MVLEESKTCVFTDTYHSDRSVAGSEGAMGARVLLVKLLLLLLVPLL